MVLIIDFALVLSLVTHWIHLVSWRKCSWKIVYLFYHYAPECRASALEIRLIGCTYTTRLVVRLPQWAFVHIVWHMFQSNRNTNILSIVIQHFKYWPPPLSTSSPHNLNELPKYCSASTIHHEPDFLLHFVATNYKACDGKSLLLACGIVFKEQGRLAWWDESACRHWSIRWTWCRELGQITAEVFNVRWGIALSASFTPE